MYDSIKQKKHQKMASWIHSNITIESYFQKCVQNMYEKIKQHGLQKEFLNVNSNQEEFKKTGFLFCNEDVMSKICDLTEEDGHSGCSFACCCRNVYTMLQRERKQQLRARFRGVVRAIIQFKRLRCRVLETFYAPGGKEFLNAQDDFNRILQGCRFGKIDLK